MPQTATKATRRISPILLLLAALCFLLALRGRVVQQLGAAGFDGSLPGGSGGATASCLSTISNTDLYSYSGLNLATGSAPSTATIPSAVRRPRAAPPAPARHRLSGCSPC